MTVSVPNLKPLANTNGEFFAKDQEAEIHVNAYKSEEGKEGGAEVMCLEGTMDQETEKGADESHLTANRDHLLAPASWEPAMEECTVYINREVLC